MVKKKLRSALLKGYTSLYDRGANDPSDGIRAGGEDLGGFCDRDAADGDQGQIGELAHVAKPRDSLWRLGVRLGSCREDRTETEVVYGQIGRGADLFGRVRGEPDEKAVGRYLSCINGWQIALSEVYAIGPDGHGEIEPIIDDQACARGLQDREKLFGHRKDLFGRAVFGTELKESCAPGT